MAGKSKFSIALVLPSLSLRSFEPKAKSWLKMSAPKSILKKPLNPSNISGLSSSGSKLSKRLPIATGLSDLRPSIKRKRPATGDNLGNEGSDDDTGDEEEGGDVVVQEMDSGEDVLRKVGEKRKKPSTSPFLLRFSSFSLIPTTYISRYWSGIVWTDVSRE